MKQINSSSTSPEILNSLSHFLPEAIYRSTPTAGLLYANQAMVKMFGYKNEKELLHVQPCDLYADTSDRNRIQEKLDSTGYVQDEKVLLKSKRHETFWGLMNCIKRSSDHCPVYYDGLIININSLVLAEKQLKEKNQLLEKVTQELDRFIYSASHDLRAPVSSIQGLVNLVKMNGFDPSFPEMAQESLNKLDRVVRQLAEFATIRHGRLDPVKINFQEIVQRVEERLKSNHHYSEGSILLLVDNQAVFYSDPSLIEIILFHSLKNSLDFIAPKVSPTITVQITQTANSSYVTIKDNGRGIARGVLPHVFEMFFKGSQNSTGSGLGLYLVREAVQALKGAVSIHSEFSKGTTLKVEIPNDEIGILIERKNSFMQDGNFTDARK